MTQLTMELVGEKALVARLREMSGAIRRALLKAVTISVIDLQGKIQAKLAGPVLKERTHHLHDSIHYEVTSDETSVTGLVGTDVVYARYHEYGFHGTEQVREHLRRISVAFGHPIATVQATVRAHARHVDYAGHPFLRPTLAENAEAITERLDQAIQGAAKGEAQP